MRNLVGPARVLLLLGLTGLGCTRQNMAVVVPMADGGTSGGPLGSDLPCDVAAVAQAHCWSCHGITPVSPGLASLMTREDWIAPSKSDPSKPRGAVVLERIASTTDPMPPAPAAKLASADIGTLTTWVQAGYPAGSCGAITDPYGTPTVCTSGSTWTRGDRGSANMHPGGTCIDCHASEEDAPSFSFAGTVYPTAHEPDDCNGASGIQVVITGANGASITLTANAVGNFFSRSSQVSTPFTAKVVSNGKERVMATPQTNGDCNACHTETGNENAPGRIMAP